MSATTESLPPLDAPTDDELVPRPVRVAAVRRETHDTITLDLDCADMPLHFTPGQFDMLSAHGLGEAAISISSDPARPGLVSHTIREVGWVTTALDRMEVGDTIGMRGPYGRGWPLQEAVGGDLVIVAGGIGLAPVRPAVLHALAHRDQYHEVCLLVGARTPGDLVFRQELESWVRDPRLFTATIVDRAGPGWEGPVGVVTRLVDRAPFDPDTATVITCGPEIMMRFVARSALARGVSPHRIHASLERNMRCGVGTCGHCQLGPVFVCRDGPVFPWPDASTLLEVREW